MSTIQETLLDHLYGSPTAYQAVARLKEKLDSQGFMELYQNQSWDLKPGQNYYVSANGSSLLAWRMPKDKATGFSIIAAHLDSPCFKVKPNGEIYTRNVVELNTQPYGGAIWSSWFDRPLHLAGRVMVKKDGSVIAVPMVVQATPLVIPNPAIHMNREANNGVKLDAQRHLLPVLGLSNQRLPLLRVLLAKELKVKPDDILAHDLYLINRQKGEVWGVNKEMLSSPRLDDQACAWLGYEAFTQSESSENIPVLACFDNEEVGSATRQGAASTFLFDTLSEIAAAVGGSVRKLFANSLFLSCDNGHAAHPNYPEFDDPTNSANLNEGILIKHNARTSYTTDGLSWALFAQICEMAEVKTQHYTNRSNIMGGGTLAQISLTQVSMPALDIGLPQWAMHSSYETCGALDIASMLKAMTAFYCTKRSLSEGSWVLKS